MALGAGNLHSPLPHPHSHTHTHSHMQSQSSSTSLLQVNGRSSSLSPSLGRKMATGNHIVRVAMSNNDSCMYKSILVSGCTFRKWVLRRIMKWHQGEEIREVKGLLSGQWATWLLFLQDGKREVVWTLTARSCTTPTCVTLMVEATRQINPCWNVVELLLT